MRKAVEMTLNFVSHPESAYIKAEEFLREERIAQVDQIHYHLRRAFLAGVDHGIELERNKKQCKKSQ